jgi:hypothetical protein
LKTKEWPVEVNDMLEMLLDRIRHGVIENTEAFVDHQRDNFNTNDGVSFYALKVAFTMVIAIANEINNCCLMRDLGPKYGATVIQDIKSRALSEAAVSMIKQIKDEYGGEIPDEVKKLMDLFGIKDPDEKF